MHTKKHSRRHFLRDGAALAGLAVAGVQLAKGQGEAEKSSTSAAGSDKGEATALFRLYGTEAPLYGTPSENIQRLPTIDYPFATRTPQQDLYGIITPSGLHFVVNHGNPTPDIDALEHRLMIHGMVDRPLLFTVAELKRLPSVSRVHFLALSLIHISEPTRPY